MWYCLDWWSEYDLSQILYSNGCKLCHMIVDDYPLYLKSPVMSHF